MGILRIETHGSFGESRREFSAEYVGHAHAVGAAIDYLTEGSDLISIRSRELKLRLLDNTYLKGNDLKWKLINVVIPPLLVIIFGIIYIFIRKKRYSA